MTLLTQLQAIAAALADIITKTALATTALTNLSTFLATV
jgi:hypothetical protein